ncbi:MAG: hypothetical protein ACT4N5_00960 [Nitrosopumilaceae archaeon]
MRYGFLLKNRGFLSPNQKKRLLGLKKKERQTEDSDFWWRIKHTAQNAILDLQLICEIANDVQLEDIFRPLVKEDYVELDKNKGIWRRTDMKTLFARILSVTEPQDYKQPWKNALAGDLINTSIDYFIHKKRLYTKLHQRIFQEVRDVISLGY